MRVSVVQISLSLTVAVVICSVSYAELRGSKHDFSDARWNVSSGKLGQLCAPCHTPHNGDSSVVPLWSHKTATATSFRMYGASSDTMDASRALAPSAVSLACLGCHDGVTALDAFGGNPGSGRTLLSEGYGAHAVIGTDLSNDHPISIDYDSALARRDGELRDPATAGSSGLGGSIEKDMLHRGKLECVSCHDVHDKERNEDMLLKSNDGSALCLTCHIK
jgi:predicted CXXCH cytochrome family protein